MPEEIKSIREIVIRQVDNGYTVRIEFVPSGNTMSMWDIRTLIAANLDDVHNIINEWVAKVVKPE